MPHRAMLGRLPILAILILAAVPLSAQQQVSGEVEVRASVVSNCKLTLTPLDFGSYDPLGAHHAATLDTTAKLVLTCTPNSQVTVAMDQGRNTRIANLLTARAMTFSDAQLSYDIFRDAARTQLWGKGADALQFVSRRSATSQEFTVYARIPAGQEVAAGTYTDVLTATVQF